MIIDIIKAIVYGIVEGFTEWLPISSTGHLILVGKLLPFENMSEAFLEVFNVVIQLGAILSIVVLFFKKIWPLSLKKDSKNNKICVDKDILKLWEKIIIACIPAAIIGIPFDDFFEEHFYNPLSIAIALILVGIVFIIIEIWNSRRDLDKEKLKDSIKDITIKDAIIIGVFQVLAAIFPGVSRSGATIIGALILGYTRKNAAEFTFYLAIPTMFGASLLKLLKLGFTFTIEEGVLLLVAMITSFIVSLAVIKFIMNYIKKHDFKIFAYYRIVLGVLIIVLSLVTPMFA